MLLKAAKTLFYFITAVAALCLLSIVGWYQLVKLSVMHDSTSDISEVPARKAAMVLGTTPKLQDGSPNPYFEYRMDAAAELYHNKKAEIFLVSGLGRTYYSEVRSMTAGLIERGVPHERIISDPAGLRTLDSVYRAKDHYGLSSFTLVSQPFHCHRALYLCREKGIDASAYEAKSVTRSDLWFKNMMREHGARMKMAADLYFLDTQPAIQGRATPDQVEEAATSLAK